MKSLVIFCVFLFCLVLAQFAQAQTVDEVIDNYINAIGDKEKLLALKTSKMEGSMSVQGFDVNIVNTIAHGVGSRTDIVVPGAGEGFQIMTPTKGWSYMPFQGQTSPEEVSKELVKEGQTSLDMQSPLLNYAEKGNTAELMGKEKVDGADCYKIKVTLREGRVSMMFFDATTYYRVKSISMKKVNGKDSEEITTYSDFKKIPEGYVFPFSTTTTRGTLMITNIEINKPVDESIFKAN